MLAKQHLTERLERETQILFALLFGSRAKGNARESSDWDVGVYLDPELGEAERFRWQRRLLASLAPRYELDLVVLNEAPPLLAHRCLQGERLFVRDQTLYVRFFVRTLAMAGDDRYWADLHARERAARLKEGRFGRP